LAEADTPAPFASEIIPSATATASPTIAISTYRTSERIACLAQKQQKTVQLRSGSIPTRFQTFFIALCPWRRDEVDGLPVVTPVDAKVLSVYREHLSRLRVASVTFEELEERLDLKVILAQKVDSLGQNEE
jgi:hypothetical protein